MLKDKVNDIEIWYDEGIDIEKAKLIINNNYEMFLRELDNNLVISLVPTNENVLYIENLDEYTYNSFGHFFDSEKIKKAYQDLSLENIYLLFLTRNICNGNARLINVNNAVSNENFNNIFSFIVPYLYFRENGNKDSYVEYMKYRNQDTSLKIYLWLKNKCLYGTYNMVQEIIVEKIRKDQFFYNNFGNILNVMYGEMKNYCEEDNINDLPKISIEKMNELMNFFLKTINAPESWINKYNELVENKKIIYEESEKNNGASMCFIDDNNELKILIQRTGTIKDFLALVHEFMHYLSWNDNFDLSQISILEFPSIFFEKLAAVFLTKYGYDKKIVKYAEDFRNMHNVSTVMDLYPIFSSIYEYMINGPINRADEIKKVEAMLQKHKNVSGEVITLKDLYAKIRVDIEDISIQEFVHQKYDRLTKDIIENDVLILDGFQYIIGTFLSRILLNNYDSSIINKMIMVTNNLYNLDLEKVLHILNLEDVLQDKVKRKK